LNPFRLSRSPIVIAEALPARPGPLHRAAVLLPLLAAVLSLAACQRAEEPPPPEIRPVRTVTIDKRAAGGAVAITGTVQAQTEVNESFRIDGRLIERLVDVGDTVRPGQLIARLDPQNEESSVQAARAQLEAALAREIEARSNFQRMRDLVVEDAVSRAQFEQAESMFLAAQAQVQTARSQLTLAQNRLGYTRLFATVAGVVTARGPEPGEVVSPGRMVVQVAREGARDAVFDVPLQVKNSAPKHPDIVVSLVSDPSVTANGRVREVSPRADAVTGTFAVRVRLIDPPPEMRLGTTVTGRMTTDRAPAIEVPATALVRSNGSTAVWIVDPTAKTVSLRNIQVGSGDASTAQVTSGLQPGDVVVTAGVQALRPGQKVRLLEGRS
jgi:RND family efflux transporter MFP subunit